MFDFTVREYCTRHDSYTCHGYFCFNCRPFASSGANSCHKTCLNMHLTTGPLDCGPGGGALQATSCSFRYARRTGRVGLKGTVLVHSSRTRNLTMHRAGSPSEASHWITPCRVGILYGNPSNVLAVAERPGPKDAPSWLMVRQMSITRWEGHGRGRRQAFSRVLRSPEWICGTEE